MYTKSGLSFTCTGFWSMQIFHLKNSKTMSAYSFKIEFCEYVEEGSKLHTVRGERTGKTGHAAPGDTVYLYYAMRNKACRKLGEGICTRQQKITVSNTQIFIAGSALSPIDMNKFAWRDGFRPEVSTAEQPGASWAMMRTFWLQHHPECTTPEGWKGVIIHWQLKPREQWTGKNS